MIPVYIVVEPETKQIWEILEDKPDIVNPRLLMYEFYVKDMSELVRLKNAL